MSADPPDMTGYPLEEARKALAAAGCETIEVARVGRSDGPGEERRTMVIRQRATESGGVELTVASEWRTPIPKNT